MNREFPGYVAFIFKIDVVQLVGLDQLEYQTIRIGKADGRMIKAHRKLFVKT